MEAFDKFLASQKYHDVLSIVKGFRNGAVYGAKIRFPHALVMSFLFRNGSVKDKLRFAMKATYTHSKNLALFVTIYKSVLLVLKKLRGVENQGDAFVAGIVGGYIIFGEDTAVNQQISLYVFARIMIGLASLAVKKNVIAQPPHAYPVFAAVVWGIVMYLFRHDRDVLQPSLQASMQYLYNDSDKFDKFMNFIWYNKA
ncbi:hypothetical protein SmJEL517_g02623 [Synchytrium microbalum]|uniref:Peroxisomal membrane protein 4 n=1 Tax=Synchytrium microbalum TaxID=1806994 RepID=A0A507C6D3_9FUNG|nr:uncharacterized protein SmJEL517_g02623 [Synchytrium microbalum]TPX34908.1 hypothetical protein SmJEL517_g02623 [Synchytrium microbalum]